MSIKHKDPEWRPINIICNIKYGIEGYNYQLINNYDQLIDCWMRGNEEFVTKESERIAKSLNANDRLYVKQNVKQKALPMTSKSYGSPK